MIVSPSMARIAVAGGVIGLLVLGCGGKGGSASGIADPAPEPTCSFARAEAAPLAPQTASDARFFVPESSRERPEDVGERLRTTHIVYRGPSAGRGHAPAGLVPEQLRNAYNVPASAAGSGAIAIVVAYDYASAVDDFNVFSAQFGLPTEPSADPTSDANAVLQVVYASGSRPTSDPGWNQEAALDTQWAHAMAPDAKIYLVEADSSRTSDLFAAVEVAKRLPNVRQVSMSFGGTETSCSYATYDPVMSQPGVSFFAAAGDNAAEKLFPGLSRRVVSVGGTTLDVNGAGARLSEVVWSQTGGGVSGFSPRPPFQNVVAGLVGRYRGGADVAAVADPSTGLSVYTSVSDGGGVGWLVIGGTSAATPVIAGIVNAAGRGGDTAAVAARLYAARGGAALFDVTSGRAGPLVAGPGYDLASGVGAPNGLGAF